MKKEELKEQAIQLSEEGLSLGKIAQQLGIGKTTVHTWINERNGERTEKNVPDLFGNEIKEIEAFKEGLQDEFGTENDVQLLVALKKAELEHSLQMEKIDLERERMQNERILRQKSMQPGKTEQLAAELEQLKAEMEQERQKSERLTAIIEKLEQNNRLLSSRFNNIESENKEITKTGPDKKLVQCFLEQLDNYLGLDEMPITLNNVEEVLEGVEKTIRRFKKWIKNHHQKKSGHIELDILKKIQGSLNEMAEEFDESGEEELIFSLEPEFKKELEEWKE